MVWEPFALAVVMGLLVSAAIYFIVMWPQVEPAAEDGDGDVDQPAAASPPAATGDGDGNALS